MNGFPIYFIFSIFCSCYYCCFSNSLFIILFLVVVKQQHTKKKEKKRKRKNSNSHHHLFLLLFARRLTVVCAHKYKALNHNIFFTDKKEIVHMTQINCFEYIIK